MNLGNWLRLGSGGGGGADVGYYYVVLAVTVVCCVVMVLIRRSRMGRLLRAFADSPTAVDANGTNTNELKVLIFSVAAFFAAIAGALLGPITGTADAASGIDVGGGVEPDRLRVARHSRRAVRGPVTQGMARVVPPAPGTLGGGKPAGAPEDPARGRRGGDAGMSMMTDQRALAPTSDAPDLVVSGLTVRFGGLVAVDNVSLTARGGVPEKGPIVSQADVDVIEAFLKAFSAGDLENAFALVHPDIVINEGYGLPYAGDHVGMAGFQNLLGKIFEPFEMGVDSYEVSDAGSCVMVKLLMAFTSRASGRTVKMPGVELYTVTDGQVARIDVYYKDTRTIHDLVSG